jgi:cobaltochelatase CobT
MRGASDSFALKKKHHNEKLLNQITNQNIDIKEEVIFLERIRYEYQGSQNYLGIKRNIQKKWLKRLEGIKLKKQSDLLDLLLFTLTHFFLDASNGKIWNKKNEYLKKISTKENINQIYEYLINFIEVINNQKLFAEYSVDLLRLIFPKQEDNNKPEDKNNEEGPQEEDVNKQQNNQEAQKPSPEEQEITEDVNTPENDLDNNQSSVQGEEIDIEITDQQIEETLQSIESYKNLSQNYKAATSQYDEIIEAHKLCDLEELIALRKQLDEKNDLYQKQISRLANKLYRKLQSKQNRSWNFDLDEGILDTSN